MTNRSKAEGHLGRADPVMKQLIKKLGPCPLSRRRKRTSDPFASLVGSIVAQRISSKAARTVHERLKSRLGEETPTPAGLLALSTRQLRAAGLPKSKAESLRTLARAVASEQLPLDGLSGWSNDQVSQALTEIKGVGQWTANMFLLFHLRRPDVFPAKDLGVREGIRRAYGLDERPTARQALERSTPWAPYRSTAAWYLWRCLEGPVGLG